MTHVEKKALKKLRKKKRKSKTNESPLNISSSSPSTDDPSFHGDPTSSSHCSVQSPLANVGEKVKKTVKKEKKTKGNVSGKKGKFCKNCGALYYAFLKAIHVHVVIRIKSWGGRLIVMHAAHFWSCTLLLTIPLCTCICVLLFTVCVTDWLQITNVVQAYSIIRAISSTFFSLVI